MKKIAYPTDIEKLKAEYLSIFAENLTAMQTKWDAVRKEIINKHSDKTAAQDIYPDQLKDIIIADYDKLVDIYCDYCSLTIGKDIVEKLRCLFSYDGTDTDNTAKKYQPDIAQFFMEHSEEMHIHVCHYCELSYINVYGLKNIYSSVSSLLKTASEKEIRRYVTNTKGEPYKDNVYKKIIKLRDTLKEDEIEEAFNNIDKRWSKSPKKSERIFRKRNHFDLDHFLPKSKCPIVALSLMNFVPCCPVCNERLKGMDCLGSTDKNRLIKLSPTSPKYEFDQQVTAIVIPEIGTEKRHAQDHPDDFSVKFETTDNEYQTVIIDEFHLDERYNYHKMEILRLLDLLRDYPDTQIRVMANALSGMKSEEQIKEDIFGMDFMERNGRCMSKIKKDIFNTCQA